MATTDLSLLLKLPSKKRMELAEQLWLSVAEDASLPVTPEHARTIRSRLANYRAGNAKVVSHDELMKRVRSL